MLLDSLENRKRNNSSMSYNEYVEAYNRVPRKPIITYCSYYLIAITSPKEAISISPFHLKDEESPEHKNIQFNMKDI